METNSNKDSFISLISEEEYPASNSASATNQSSFVVEWHEASLLECYEEERGIDTGADTERFQQKITHPIYHFTGTITSTGRKNKQLTERTWTIQRDKIAPR